MPFWRLNKSMTKKRDKEACGFRQKGHYFPWPTHAHSSSYKSMPLNATLVHIPPCLNMWAGVSADMPMHLGAFSSFQTWGNGTHRSPCQGYMELDPGGKQISAPMESWFSLLLEIKVFHKKYKYQKKIENWTWSPFFQYHFNRKLVDR